MITDRQLRCSSAQAITTAGTRVSTDVIDLGSANNISRANNVLRAHVVVETAFVGGTNLTVNYVQSANADLSSPDILATTGAILTATLIDGAVLMDLRIPNNTKRYVGFQYVSTGTYTAGALDARLVETSDSNKLYPAHSGL